MSPGVSLGPVGSVPPRACASSSVAWVEEEMSGVAVGWRWSWRGAEEEDGQRCLPGFTVGRKAAGAKLAHCTS